VRTRHRFDERVRHLSPFLRDTDAGSVDVRIGDPPLILAASAA
jgi:hypothetical protein